MTARRLWPERLVPTLLLMMAMLSGCSTGGGNGFLKMSDTDAALVATGLGVAVITAPIWYPASRLFDAFERARPDNGRPVVESSLPNLRLEARPIEVPGTFGDRSTAILPERPGRFFVLHRPADIGAPPAASLIDVEANRVLGTWPLPHDVVPLGVRDGALYVQSGDHATLLIVREGAGRIETRSLPPGCDDLISSPHTRYAACLTGNGVSTIDLLTGFVKPVPNPWQGIASTAITDEGRLVQRVDFRAPSRAADRNGQLDSTPLCGAISGSCIVGGDRHVARVHDGRVSLSDATGRVVFEMSSGRTPDVFASSNGRFAIVTGEEVLVVSPGQGAFHITMPTTSLPRSAVFGAAWDDGGERLILLRGNGKGYAFRFPPTTPPSPR